jgi:predicted Zn-dependent protease
MPSIPASIATLALLAALGIAGCFAPLATSGGEAKVGAAAADEVERSMGLVDAPDLERYVADIGARLVESSPDVRRDVEYSFKIIDMAETNAFALPGGYIYVSRGLLAVMNSEAELANVMAHEVAHVSARHHLKHAMRQTPLLPVRLATGIGGFAASLVSPKLGSAIGAIGRAPGSLVLAKHSRSAENEADTLGQKYAAAAGWEPSAMAGVMEALARDHALRGGDPNRRGFLDTHPSSPDRARDNRKRARDMSHASRAPIAADRVAFYRKLDGLLVGPPAHDGVITDNEFLHRQLDVRVAFPEGWEVQNLPTSVSAAPGSRQALAVFTIAAEDGDPLEVAKAVVEKAGLRLDGEIEKTTIGSLPAARAEGRTREGLTSLRHVLYWVAHRDVVYEIVGSTRAENWRQYRSRLIAVAESFRPLVPADHERVREARLRVREGRAGEDWEALLQRTDAAWNPEQAAAANGLDVPGPGEPVKVAVWQVYRPQK